MTLKICLTHRPQIGRSLNVSGLRKNALFYGEGMKPLSIHSLRSAPNHSLGNSLPNPYLHLLALSVNQCAGGRELDADAGVALVINDLLLAFPSRMRADQNLAQLADLVPTQLSLIDEIEKL